MEYAINGMVRVVTPTTNFFRSWSKAAIFPLVTHLKNSKISKILAEATDSMTKNGMSKTSGEVRGFRKAITSKTRGTGT